MTIQECYQNAGGNYEEVSTRIGSEAFLLKYLGKFQHDKSYQELLTALSQENWQEAFFCAHNLKGLCGNLALTQAWQAASALCEALRHGKPQEDISVLCSRLGSAYQQTLDAISRVTDV